MKKILISQPAPSAAQDPYSSLSRKFGVTVDFQPLVEVVGLKAREFRDLKISPIDFSAIVFTSRMSVDHYFRLCKEMRLQVPETMHYYCIHQQVSNYLQKYIEFRKRRVFFSETHDFTDLLPLMAKTPEENYLMIVGDSPNEEILHFFEENDMPITTATMFHTVSVPWPDNKPFDYDIVTFFTVSAVESFLENFPDFKQKKTVFIAHGQNTQAALESAGFKVDYCAPTESCPSVLAAIEKALNTKSRH